MIVIVIDISLTNQFPSRMENLTLKSQLLELEETALDSVRDCQGGAEWGTGWSTGRTNMWEINYASAWKTTKTLSTNVQL